MSPYYLDDFFFFQCGQITWAQIQQFLVDSRVIGADGAGRVAHFAGVVGQLRHHGLEAHFAEIIVPRGTVFVLADNRRGFGGTDSRGVGPVAKWAVKGRFESGFVSLFFSALKFW